MAEINQIPTQISKEDILSIQIPLIMVLIIISSLEIIIFHFCHGTWKKLILDAEDKIDLNVRFFKHILQLTLSFFQVFDFKGDSLCKETLDVEDQQNEKTISTDGIELEKFNEN